jgi:hypothetical protein
MFRSTYQASSLERMGHLEHVHESNDSIDCAVGYGVSMAIFCLQGYVELSHKSVGRKGLGKMLQKPRKWFETLSLRNGSERS